MKIVVADDSDDALAAISLALSLLGHEVHVASDGEEALEAIDRHSPDLAIVDLGMPILDGYDVALAVRADQSKSHMHLIAHSGFGAPNDKARAIRSGFDQHVTKPATMQQLEAAIARAASC